LLLAEAGEVVSISKEKKRKEKDEQWLFQFPRVETLD